MLDVFLWLPTREGLVVFDRNYCRVHRIKYEAKENVYYEYTMVFLDQVSNTASRIVFCSTGVYRKTMGKGGVITSFANGLFVAVEALL